MIRKFAYSLGAVATALSYQAFSAYIIFFYVDIKKLSVGLAGIAMLIFALWNAINDPLFGYLSDGTHTRFGRRIPYLMAGAIPLGLVFCLLWVPPFSGIEQESWLFLYFVLMIFLFDAFYSMVVINWSSLYPEMFPSLKDRAQVNSYRQTFVMFGLFMGISLPPLIYSKWGWGWMGVVFGLIISVVILIALWGSRENKEYSSQPSLPFINSLKATFKNRSFLTFAFSNLFVQFSFTLILATIPFFAKYVLRSDPAETTLILAAAFLIAIPMLFVWRGLAVRWGVKYCFMAAMLLLIISLFPLFLIDNLNQALLVSLLIGAGIAGFLQMADLILSDVIDEDEINTGHRREGMYFGASAFINRFAIGLEAASMSGIFILSGYTPYVYTQPANFQTGLRYLIAGLPIIALVLAFVIIIFYPLAGNRLEELRIKLAEVHGRKGVI